MKVCLLAGGTGGAKLAAGLADLDDVELTVVANSGDDIDVHGVRVSPDPDLVTYWLAGEIDEARGWGLLEDSFEAHRRLARLGAPDWFSLGDRDLATCLYRTHFMAEGGTATAAQAQIATALGVEAAVLPMTEAPVRTFVLTPAGRRSIQEFLILDHGEAEIRGIEVDGLEGAGPTPEVAAAIAAADAVVIGPSNPVLSIGPILAIAGIREAIATGGAPVVAVSPLVGGRSIKGPTEACLRAIGRPVSAAGVASLYAPLLDAIVLDAGDPEPEVPGIRVHATETLMEGPAGRAALAREVLDAVAGLTGSGPTGLPPIAD
ncbi:2-phospho-L-lactate transferase [Thermoleophilia bacterium SCSIO 60948]|nr:2-phospho-L-lactate transferase [Thermoleophilia bacterium SCSIO 60948]